ncbi:MAG: hypothetical protein MJE63_34000 [Proteobacteria bacterium]|nr:hypothetical protein [Pseudomonadota bacterium]
MGDIVGLLAVIGIFIVTPICFYGYRGFSKYLNILEKREELYNKDIELREKEYLIRLKELELTSQKLEDKSENS